MKRRRWKARFLEWKGCFDPVPLFVIYGMILLICAVANGFAGWVLVYFGLPFLGLLLLGSLIDCLIYVFFRP